MSSAAEIQVLIVDDQPMVRAGFAALIDAQPEMQVVGVAPDGIEAISQAKAMLPNIILMDIRMPHLDGLTAMQEIFALNWQQLGAQPPKVIILTTFDADEYVFTALRNGASGFLLKDAEVEELVGAIRMVHAGGAMLSPSITRTVIENFTALPASPLQAPEDNPELAELSQREQEVMKLIAAGLSNAEIGAKIFLAEPTVKSHVSHILNKLELRDRTQIAIFAYESGLVRIGEAGAGL